MKHIKLFESVEQRSIEDTTSYQNVILTFWLSDDWVGMYIDGDLIESGHSLYAGSVVSKLVKRGVNLYNYRYGSISFYKNGESIEYPSKDNGELVMYDLPKNIDEIIEKMAEHDITYKINLST